MRKFYPAAQIMGYGISREILNEEALDDSIAALPPTSAQKTSATSATASSASTNPKRKNGRRF